MWVQVFCKKNKRNEKNFIVSYIYITFRDWMESMRCILVLYPDDPVIGFTLFAITNDSIIHLGGC